MTVIRRTCWFETTARIALRVFAGRRSLSDGRTPAGRTAATAPAAIAYSDATTSRQTFCSPLLKRRLAAIGPIAAAMFTLTWITEYAVLRAPAAWRAMATYVRAMSVLTLTPVPATARQARSSAGE